MSSGAGIPPGCHLVFINIDQIYARRNGAIRAALDDTERGKVETARDRIAEAIAETTLSAAVRGKLEAARDQLNEVLGAGTARETGALLGPSSIRARRPLDLERGRALPPRPRSLADVARTHYAQPERRLTR